MSLRFRIPTGGEIRDLRRKAGLTQAELAEKAGMSQSMVARIESGGVDPRLSTLNKVLDALESVDPPLLLARDIMNRPVIYVTPNQTIREVINILQNTGFSQIPVLEDGKPIGSLEESTLLSYISLEHPNQFLQKQVHEMMLAPFPTVSAEMLVDGVYQLLAAGHPAVLVTEDETVVGIICKIDVIAVSSAKRRKLLLE
jgi:predicted transcriptional regulator